MPLFVTLKTIFAAAIPLSFHDEFSDQPTGKITFTERYPGAMQLAGTRAVC